MGVVTVSVDVVAPAIAIPPFVHWYVYPDPVVALSILEPPVQKVNEPDGVMTGISGEVTDTVAKALLTHPAALTTV
jgi:hypothetical protein